ncbi:hypothetical protein BGX38DRAFT_1240714, partial [Terfezia claveryi]
KCLGKAKLDILIDPPKAELQLNLHNPEINFLAFKSSRHATTHTAGGFAKPHFGDYRTSYTAAEGASQ